MEAELMASVVALDASPVDVLRSMRGSVVAALLSYPDVLHVEIRDSADRNWRLATQDAQWWPSDPSELLDSSIDDAEIDAGTGELRLRRSDRSALVVIPGRREAGDDPPNWELITPDGLTLEFGPGLRWQISSADVRVPPAA